MLHNRDYVLMSSAAREGGTSQTVQDRLQIEARIETVLPRVRYGRTKPVGQHLATSA
jgi:hypothetical protein